MSIKARQRVERSIARRVVLDAIRAGYTLSVFNGEDIEIKQSRDVRAVLAAMFTTDDEYLLLHKADSPTPETPRDNDGWIRFVYGNDGYDVVSDYRADLETLMKGANALADKYAD